MAMKKLCPTGTKYDISIEVCNWQEDMAPCNTPVKDSSPEEDDDNNTNTSGVDWVNLMTYDMHGGWEATVNHMAPLYPGSDVGDYDYPLSCQWAVDYWLDHGCPASKLTLGIGTYGRGYTLANRENNDFGDAAKGAGPPQTYTQEAGMIAYYEVLIARRDDSNSEVRYDEHQEIPVLTTGDEWWGFEDVRSVVEKVKYAKSKDLLGIMFWALDMDDFPNGSSSSQKDGVSKNDVCQRKSVVYRTCEDSKRAALDDEMDSADPIVDLCIFIVRQRPILLAQQKTYNAKSQ
eukprot:gene3646-4581_t